MTKCFGMITFLSLWHTIIVDVCFSFISFFCSSFHILRFQSLYYHKRYLHSYRSNIVLSEKKLMLDEMYGIVSCMFISNIFIEKLYVLSVDKFICMYAGGPIVQKLFFYWGSFWKFYFPE